MKYLVTLLSFLLPTIGLAQSAIPSAVQEFLNPSPRMEYGDSQRYELTIDYLTLDSLGIAEQLIRNVANYTQICLKHSDDSLRFEVVIDSFGTGMAVARSGRLAGKQHQKDFEGYGFQYALGKEFTTDGDCFDPSGILDDTKNYVQAQEFMDQFTVVRLIEQFRYMAGRSLAYIGDTAVFELPSKICYDMPGLVNSARIYEQPYHMRVLGISRYGNEPCALIEVNSRPSPIFITFVNTEGEEVEAVGSRMLTGRVSVSLRNGALLATDIQQRLQGRMKGGGFDTHNQRVIYTRLRAVY